MYARCCCLLVPAFRMNLVQKTYVRLGVGHFKVRRYISFKLDHVLRPLCGLEAIQ